ncbi:hypothetical protein E8E15_000174 [Penicillium rubens]|uniref:uncharacterized protein n=1 Tax=Penicillium chrysogenum TaxID=5076 RepID=UPI001D8FCCA5|nr:uncharacterized protein N7489_006975 [Penicillium chrysogenum]XP_061070987.1 uncharacterized protein N7525_001090 [Penicillium rubens]KAF3012496.1 hypothetical protein E8E15_000174 [Penicillium rubens]KAJ5236884.1 hypothetical protein N7489_006975 [Penicillium chrysogenum]KAJ5276846.1 hypothetical protein N7524_002999 [Penicillium chrysogenum]KAJ5843349.1 hypothetical protein N7525_001090 [Penicillium rubens]KAJ5846066.1 hypothetical protein N7534_009735 [Penicillium rubens]
MAPKKSKLPKPKRVNFPPRRSRRLAGLAPQTVFSLEEAELPPGSPLWREEPRNGTKPTRWAPTDPLGFSSDPEELGYYEWGQEHGVQERMRICYDLTNCVPVFISQDRCSTLFESNGRYYMWARDGNSVVRILHDDLEEIKQIITDWGEGALSMEYMGDV